MSDTLSALPSTGEIMRSLEVDCEMEWRIPGFISLMKRDNIYFSPTFSLNGALWRMFIDVEFIHLNAGIIRESTLPSMNLEVSVGFKTSNGKKDQRRYAVDETRDGCEAYISFNCLQKTELLKRMSDLLPSNVLTVMCTLMVQKGTENAVRKCGLVFSTTYYKAYRCRTCALRPSMSLCFDCFKRGNHEGHDFNLFPCSIGGFCDCGDKSFLKESGFCHRHGPRHQLKKSETPPDLLFVAEVLMPRFFLRLSQHLQGNSESDESCASASSNVLQENKILNDLKELFLNKEDCDVLIKVQGQEYQAHKAILKARSPVLASTFRNDMKEKSTGVVDVEDCDPSSFSDFLCFIYCGDKGIISQGNVFSLFTTADKYDVQDLRDQCVMFMKANLCIDTLCDTMGLALRHSESELVNLATEFFVENAIEIIKTVKWQSFLSENPTVGNELFLQFASSTSKSSK